MKYLHFVTYKVHVRIYHSSLFFRGSRGHDRMVVGFTTTCAISDYHHWCCEFEWCSWRGVLNTTLHDIVCHQLSPSNKHITAKIDFCTFPIW